MNEAITKALSKEDLVEALKRLGVESGMVLEVHSALSKLGFIIGGAETYNDALIEAIGHNGTIVMPFQDAYNTEPALFRYPPIAYELQETYRSAMPAFDPRRSEIYQMGKSVENMRRREGVEFSKHPNCAFLAYGRYAKTLIAHHDLDFALDDDSPLGKLYEMKASCLFVGCSYDNMTSLHLAEYRTKVRGIKVDGAALYEDGKRVYKNYLDICLDSDDGFEEIGARLEAKGLVKMMKVGECELRLLRIDQAVLEGTTYYLERMMKYR